MTLHRFVPHPQPALNEGIPQPQQHEKRMRGQGFPIKVVSVLYVTRLGSIPTDLGPIPTDLLDVCAPS